MPKIIFMPHANIQYSQLAPEKRLWVIENCYEKLFDLIDGGDYKIAFEASGITIEEIANKCPRCLEKLKKLVAEGKIEPVSSPYIHFMLANIPKEVCVHSLKHSLDVWEKYVGKRPKIGWNPECGWASYIPDVYKEAGMEALVMDADSLLLSFDEIRKATGLQFDVAGHSNKNHLFKIEEYIKDKPEFLKFITNPSVAPNGLKMIFRSDCMANLLLWYLMGATEGLREEPINMGEIKTMLANWKERIKESGSFIMPYAEDAEYIGSSAYFYVKQFNQARFFEEEPNSVVRFKEILDAAKEAGYEYATPSEVIAEGNVIENDYVDCIENGVAWHGGTAKAWANTEYSRIMDPVCLSILNGIKAVAEKLGETLDTLDTDLNNAMMALASAWVSDSRWPPAPTSPGRFNVRESLDDMYKANDAIKAAMEKGGIADKKGLYSPNLMHTQIKAIDDKLMGMEYFGE
ncbi:MAG: glycoside hydrolase family 57 [Clostridiales bacterium]|nr:glycoside hydrolase family 57 [Clostridiales bacterium]